VTLVRALLLSSGAMSLDQTQCVSCIQLTKPPVYNLSVAQHSISFFMRLVAGAFVATSPFVPPFRRDDIELGYEYCEWSEIW
jgi:hypothetical protein